MRRVRAFFVRFAGLFRRSEAELDHEIESHLALHIDENLKAGMSAEEARRQALIRFGGVEQIKELYRDRRSLPFLEHLLQDLSYGARQLRRSPGFAASVVLLLALGIGANTAIFSFLDAILLRSLPVDHPESLVLVELRAPGSPRVVHLLTGTSYDVPGTGYSTRSFPYRAFELLEAANPYASVFAHFSTGRVNLVIHGSADVADSEYVSGNYFGNVGTTPAAGRLIGPEDDRFGAPPVAVISYAFWQGRWAGRADAVGQTILINNVPVTIIGVARRGFYGVNPATALDVWVPVHLNPVLEPVSPVLNDKVYTPFTDDHYYWIELLARLRPGISRVQAEAALAPAFANYVASTAANDRERENLPRLVVEEGAAGLDSLRRQYSRPLYVLMALVGLILAIACANVASLLLARAGERRREIAMRLGLGAGRGRIVRQLLTETVLLASLGGAAGILVALWGVQALTFLLANGRAGFTLHADLNWRVLGVAAALCVVAGLLAGLAPALQAARVDVNTALKIRDTGPASSRFGHLNLSRVLILGQLAISLVLLVAGGLFVRTLQNLHGVNVGFNPDNVLLFYVNARQAGYKTPEMARFYDDLQQKLRLIPGVRSVSFSNPAMVANAGNATLAKVPGSLNTKDNITNLVFASSDFFSTMQIPILLGRALDQRDSATAPHAAVVNEHFAKTHFGDANPIGKHFSMGTNEVEIVGVAANTTYRNLRAPQRAVAYLSHSQPMFPLAAMGFEVRTDGDPMHYANAVRRVAAQADSRIPVTDVRTQAAQIEQTINQEVVFARLCSGFAVLALVIASLGLYGSTAYRVARRTHEIGIRMALGARRSWVIRMLIRESLLLAVAGLAVGIPAALAGARYVQSFLFNMKSNDSVALASAAAVLVVSAGLAGYVPARRASKIDPMSALRHE